MNTKEKTPRSVRNNNPLNIRRSRDKWKGLAQQQTDPEFFTFATPAYGWRAAFIILTRTYYFVHHLTTLRAIISRWAPKSENDTEAYLKRVCQMTGLNPDYQIGIPSLYGARWLSIAYAMATVEAGRAPDPMPLFDGWQMAREVAATGSFRHE